MVKVPSLKSISAIPPVAHSPHLFRSMIAGVVLGSTALGCTSPQIKTPMSPVTAEKQSDNPVQTPMMAEVDNHTGFNVPRNAYDQGLTKNAETQSQNTQTVYITITGTIPKGAWPDITAYCLYTGIVLDHDTISNPPKVLLENICLQEHENLVNTFEGNHLWVTADSNNRYSIPFFNAHLKEENRELLFTARKDGQLIKESLKPGTYAIGTLSFADSLDRHNIMSIRKQEITFANSKEK